MNIDAEIRSLHKQGFSRYEIFKNLETQAPDKDQLYIRILPFLEQDIYKRALLVSISIVTILLSLAYHFFFHVTTLPQVIQRMDFYELNDWIRLFQFIVMGFAGVVGIGGLLQCRPRFYLMVRILCGILLFIVPLITAIASLDSDIPANPAALIIWNIGAITLFILSFVGQRLTAPLSHFLLSSTGEGIHTRSMAIDSDGKASSQYCILQSLEAYNQTMTCATAHNCTLSAAGAFGAPRVFALSADGR